MTIWTRYGHDGRRVLDSAMVWRLATTLAGVIAAISLFLGVFLYTEARERAHDNQMALCAIRIGLEERVALERTNQFHFQTDLSSHTIHVLIHSQTPTIEALSDLPC